MLFCTFTIKCHLNGSTSLCIFASIEHNNIVDCYCLHWYLWTPLLNSWFNQSLQEFITKKSNTFWAYFQNVYCFSLVIFYKAKWAQVHKGLFLASSSLALTTGHSLVSWSKCTLKLSFFIISFLKGEVFGSFGVSQNAPIAIMNVVVGVGVVVVVGIGVVVVCAQPSWSEDLS